MRERRRLAAIVALDVSGYSRLMSRNESGTLAAWKACRRQLIDPRIARFSGRIVKTTGDGLLLEFPSVVDAARCAVEIQRAMAKRNAGVTGDERIDFRIGVNVGDIIIDDDDIFGHGVNIAARLEALADPGGICISAKVYDEVVDQLDATFEDDGLQYVKNIEQPIHVYALHGDRARVNPDGDAWVATGTASAGAGGIRDRVAGARGVHHGNVHLPQPLTGFVGRATDLAQYQTALDSARLVTLTGVGGVGKTRLAIELAARVASRFPHGVWFVDLAPLSDPERVALTLAMTLGLTERPGRSLVESVCEHLAEQRALIVLDNCEHLIDACARLVQTLLDQTSALELLVTSREGLSVSGEHVLTVHSLSCPPVDDTRADRDLTSYDAVELFVERARLVQPGFTLDASTGQDVAEICRRLDGIPLAIELAAARTKVLSVAELRRKLDDRFRLLVGGPRMALPRQQTLLATIKWSFDLLTCEERRLLSCLSVFSGGWTLEAAVAVAGSASEYEVLDLLTHLIEKSLISSRGDAPGGTRYSMLETIRQYAAEALADSEERDDDMRRHLAYFADMTERLAPEFVGPRQKAALERLAPELDNAVLALSGRHDRPDTCELALRLAAALHYFWTWRGLLRLGYELTAQVLSRTGTGESPARARALCAAMRLASLTGLTDAAQAWGVQCLSVARSVGDHRSEAGALVALGYAAYVRDDLSLALDSTAEAVRIAREHDDDENLRRALNLSAMAQRSLGNLAGAQASLREALERAEAQGDFYAIAMLAGNLTEVYVVGGDIAAARATAAKTLSASCDNKHAMETAVELVALLAAVTNDWPFAARMWGVMKTANEASGRRYSFATEPVFAPFLAALKNPQAHPGLDAAFASGSAITLDGAIHEARAWLEATAGT